ncbi:matrixin family metalloprotease [Gemmatimonadota bacterium]
MVLVVLGAVLIAVVLLSVARGGEPSESAIPDSTARETALNRSDQLDSIRTVRAAVRKRIADSDTYLGYALAEDDSVLKRWQDRTVRMLTIHVSPILEGSGNDGLERSVRMAFDRWERVGAIPVSFRTIRDSALAEVHVYWIRSFPMARSGQAEVFWDGDGWIKKGVLTLATHDLEGRAITADVLYTVALHEIGHLLGLGHSNDPGDLMFPVTTVSDLTGRDRRTARLLYVLPPGSVTAPSNQPK